MFALSNILFPTLNQPNVVRKEYHEMNCLFENSLSGSGHKQGLTGNPKRTGGMGTLEVEVANIFKMPLGISLFNF